MTYLYFGTVTDDRSVVKRCNKTSREQPYSMIRKYLLFLNFMKNCIRVHFQ